VQQQLALALRLVVLTRRRRVWRDVHVVQPHLAVANGGKRILQLHAAVAQGLDLRALQLQAGFPLLEEVVLERRLPVSSDVSHR
jgi:hypothetical protein